MVIGEVLKRRAFKTPKRPALYFQDQVISYLELDRRTDRAAQALLALGVKSGDRVALLMNNHPRFLEVFFACARIGAVLVSLNIRLASAELDYILKDCSVSGLIYGSDFERVAGEMESTSGISFKISTDSESSSGSLDYEKLLGENEPLVPDVAVKPGDLFAIMYTSGTTGYPKGVMITHDAAYHGAVNMALDLSYQYPDKSLMLAPFFHTGASTPVIGHVIRGIATVILEKFDPVAVLELIEKHKIGLLQGVTAMMRMILNVPNADKYDLSSWRVAILPGSPLPYSLIREVYDRFGVLCQNLWGMTEISGPGSLMNIEDILDKPESAGKHYFEVDIKIADVDGNTLPPGETGEILVRAPNMMVGYWNLPEATRNTMVDGWIHSGDLGYMDKDGYLYVIDRLKDMIVSGGENVYPAEIEKVILLMEGIVETSVIGIVDEKWGEVPKAFIVSKDAAAPSDEEIIQFCRKKLAGFKIPRHIERIAELPKNPSGKVLKKRLRELPHTPHTTGMP